MAIKFEIFPHIDEADRVMEDVQNDWLSHVEQSVYTGDRQKLTAINCANSMKMQLPLQKLLFSATLSQNPEQLQQMSLYEPKLYTSIGEAYESVYCKRALVKYQSQSKVMKVMLYVVSHLKKTLNFKKFKFFKQLHFEIFENL